MTQLAPLDADAQRVVELAEDEARLLRHDELGDDHLLLGVARVDPELIGVPIEALRARVLVGRGGRPQGPLGAPPRLAESAVHAIAAASRDRGGKPVAPVDILTAIATGGGLAADALARIGVDSMADASNYAPE
jgi:ATP-dependent Clp protease ATP-binding subunit ClpC